MYRDFFTNKWILVCFALLIVFSVGCVIWYCYDTAKDRKALDDVTESVRKLENNRKVNVDKTSEERTVPTIEKSVTTTDEDVYDDSPLGVTDPKLTEQLQEQGHTEIARLSPYGFGPYPEIPLDYRAPKFLTNHSLNITN